ncbi:Lactonase, 7-bladed beta-propeller-domain-containing protein [Mucidula mucida]|nr:Lactonase, 7-bladed beta-propeller-domain-containing protein [Mucidula mucida]
MITRWLIPLVDSGGYQTVNGVAAAHCAFFPNGKTAGVANYFGQTASFFAFNATSGMFGEQLPTLDYYGYVPRDGQNTAGDEGSTTQLTAHPHMIVTHPWINTLYIPDLGQDTLHVYNFDDAGALTNFTHYDQPLGTGPRHLAITPSGRYLYLAHEITAEIRAYEVDLSDGTLTQIQDDISILPDNITHSFALSAAEIHVSNDGRFLYASNRNLTDASLIEPTDPSDTIAVFSIDPVSGCLIKIQSAMMPGARQIRSIELSPPGYTSGAGGQDFLVAGGLTSNSTAIFKRDSATGLLNLSTVLHHPELMQPSSYVWL